MIVWEWTGQDGDAQPFTVTSTGTGQSGTVALHTTAGEVLTNAQSVKVNQLTSSGSGNVYAKVTLPRPIGVDKLRFNITYRLLNNDADFYWVDFALTDFDGADGEYYGIRHNSYLGAVEEIQYYTTGATRVDTGLAYPVDKGIANIAWWTLSIDLNTTTKKYTRFALNSDALLVDLDNYSPGSYEAETGIAFVADLSGKDVASAFLIDSISLEALE